MRFKLPFFLIGQFPAVGDDAILRGKMGGVRPRRLKRGGGFLRARGETCGEAFEIAHLIERKFG